ncbi:MAG: hypothetical protein PUE33_07235 [bacterium]|nr:hypothetical protein [Mycoplasmatota bacterium]MDD6757822.1 hypothetical protein [bacterium]MDY2907650.1 hypothetical protein [Candidatus Faecimonas sp.]
MYLQVKRKKIKLIELTKFWDRFKGLKFVFEPLNYAIRFPKKKFVTTNFLCQKIDIVLTDKEDNILYMYENMKTEKYIFPKRKVYNVYFLPLNTVKNLTKNTKLKVVLTKKDKPENNKKKDEK